MMSRIIIWEVLRIKYLPSCILMEFKMVEYEQSCKFSFLGLYFYCKYVVVAIWLLTNKNAERS